MKVFIAWSGEKSKEAAEFLHSWLPVVIQSVTPFMSSESIRKGARWLPEISQTLSDCSIGILCMTSDNLANDWIHFEAGALSKSIGDAHVVPMLFGISPADVQQPLAQFQSCMPDMDGVWKLIQTLNKESGESTLTDAVLQTSFDRSWPEFEAKVSAIVALETTGNATPRTERSLLEEVVDLLRDQSRTVLALSERVDYLDAIERPRRTHREEYDLRIQREAKRHLRGVDFDMARRLYGSRLLSIEIEGRGQSTLQLRSDESELKSDLLKSGELEDQFKVPVLIHYLSPEDFEMERDRIKRESKFISGSDPKA